MLKKQHTEGFTLVELLIVILIVSILSMIAIPTFGGYRTRAYNSSALSDACNLRVALEAYYAEWQHYPN